MPSAPYPPPEPDEPRVFAPAPRLRLRTGNHHGVTLVEHDGTADRGYLVGAVIPGAHLPVEAAHALAREICEAVNARRDAVQGESRSDPGHILGGA